MGYAAAVGMMMLNDVALVNESLDNRMDAINTALAVVEQDIEEGQD